MEVQPDSPWTQVGDGDDAAREAAGSQLQPRGAADERDGPLAAVAPALFELLTRLLLTDRGIRDSWR